MSTWKQSRLASYHRENAGKCEVRIHGTKIVLSYEQHDGLTVFEGEEVAAGHFKLKCERKGGHATLHMVPGEDLLEGHWVEGDTRGMWLIRLEKKRTSRRTERGS